VALKRHWLLLIYMVLLMAGKKLFLFSEPLATYGVISVTLPRAL
jgi:hypothetical protein